LCIQISSKRRQGGATEKSSRKEYESMKQRIGFMGLGIMGVPMAANVIKAGYPLTVYNRTAGKDAELKKLGAAVSPTPKALAEASDVIIAMVTGPEALDNLLWGPEGAAQSLSEKKTFINMSSVSPMFTRELAGKLAETGVVFIDAPVSGSKKPAEDATLLILAGGPEKEIEALTPLLKTMGKGVIYCGEAGQGSMMKMMNNLLLGIMMEGLSEAVNFGKCGGLTMDSMLEVILTGPLASPIFKMKADMLQSNEFPVNFPLKHMTKDLKFVVDTAYDLGAPVPAGHALLQVFRLGVGQKWGDLDVAAVFKAVQYMNESK
jgi:3-hydroxyisobutyrate dehydrogenase-like beta-hydroxyacid dehydrogenase